MRQLRVFCTAVRIGGVTRAAEHLGLSQPAVSLQVRELKHEFGTMVRGVDALFDNLDACLDREGVPQVRLGVSAAGAAFVLPQCIERFRERWPETAVRLETVTLHEGLTRLFDERVDFVVGTREPHSHDALDYHEFLTYRIVLITPLDHPLAGRETVSPCEARTWPAVVVPPGLYTRQDGETVAHALGLDVSAVIEVGDWGLLKRYVEAGFGVAAVPSLIVNSTDRVSVASLAGPLPERSYGVYTYRDRTLTPSARRLCGMLIAGIPASYPLDRSPVR